MISVTPKVYLKPDYYLGLASEFMIETPLPNERIVIDHHAYIVHKREWHHITKTNPSSTCYLYLFDPDPETNKIYKGMNIPRVKRLRDHRTGEYEIIGGQAAPSIENKEDLTFLFHFTDKAELRDDQLRRVGERLVELYKIPSLKRNGWLSRQIRYLQEAMPKIHLYKRNVDSKNFSPSFNPHLHFANDDDFLRWYRKSDRFRPTLYLGCGFFDIDNSAMIWDKSMPRDYQVIL
jgi:hypothetical protein